MTTEKVTKLTDARIVSLMKQNETKEFMIKVLLYFFQHPHEKTYEVVGNRTVHPPFARQESEAIKTILMEHVDKPNIKTPKEIDVELQKEEE